MIKYAGLGWPPVLEEDLPFDIEPGKGVQYTSVMVEYAALLLPLLGILVLMLAFAVVCPI